MCLPIVGSFIAIKVGGGENDQLAWARRIRILPELKKTEPVLKNSTYTPQQN
jgi:hypothetical protein